MMLYFFFSLSVDVPLMRLEVVWTVYGLICSDFVTVAACNNYPVILCIPGCRSSWKDKNQLLPVFQRIRGISVKAVTIEILLTYSVSLVRNNKTK